jgi:hypothetical protein
MVIAMRWVLLDVVLMVGSVVLLLALAVGLWRKVKLVRRTAVELRGRVSGLSEEAGALTARLDPDQVLGRLAERTG